MTQHNHDDEVNLRAAIDGIRHDEAPAAELRDAAGRVWSRLQTIGRQAEPVGVIRGCDDAMQLLAAYRSGKLSSERRLMLESHMRECLACSRRAIGNREVNWATPLPARRQGLRLRWGLAVALVTIVSFMVHSVYFAIPSGARASVQSVQGKATRITPAGEYPVVAATELWEGEVLKTSAGGHAFVRLSDGSMIEVNERSELALKARGRNMTVNLDQGAVIVHAAKRYTGHLYVKTPDARVAVTGTVFSVTSGIKGSRVSVISGAVEVVHAGEEENLQAGQQISTSENIRSIPVQEDIAWSQEFKKHLELMAGLTTLQQQLSQVQLPAPRYSSTLLDRVPNDTALYISIPNLGEALSQANEILKEQMSQSEELRRWFHKSEAREGEFDEVINKIRELSRYLGDEVVVVGTHSVGGRDNVAAVAEVRGNGLREFLAGQFKSGSGTDDVMPVDSQELGTLTESNTQGKIVALVRDDVVLFSDSIQALNHLNAQLDRGVSGFATTDFGRRIADAYSRGAGLFIAADLKQMIADSRRERTARGDKPDRSFVQSGFAAATYFIAEHREVDGTPDNHLVLDFYGARRGIASWLAPPDPMGSLDFVSPNASLAVSFLTKEPKLMLDDLFRMMVIDNPNERRRLNDEQNKMQLNIREDIAAQLGGEALLALDGPVLPTPAWKFVAEVHDPARLQASLEKLMAASNSDAQQQGKKGVSVRSEDVNGQLYYSIVSLDTGEECIHYTYAAGYMVLGRTRAVIMNALRTRVSGDSLARSAEFRAILPKDQHANYSAIAYQNLAPMLKPLLSQLDARRAALVQRIAADSKPSVICAWGESDRLVANSNSRLFGYDWITLMSLLDRETHVEVRATQ